MERDLSMRGMTSAYLAGGLMLSGAAFAASVAPPKPADVRNTYQDIAHAMYEDSFTAGTALQASANASPRDPTATNLTAARAGKTAAPVPSHPSARFPFANDIVAASDGNVKSLSLGEEL